MGIPGIDLLLGTPLGYVMWFIYHFIGNYFVAIFLFTLIIRAATFPLSLKSQKAQADRARLAPRLERLQKKYGQDRQKLQQKQMALYEKEGVSMTGGCLPMVVQMLVLFGVIAVIYAPLTHLSRMPKAVINASISAASQKTDENGDTIADENRLSPGNVKSAYKELFLLTVAGQNHDDIVASIDALSADVRRDKTGEEYYESMIKLRKDFDFFGATLLTNPWTDKGFAGISVLWLIPLISGLTSFLSSFISMRFTNAAMAGQQQPGQGCTNNTMLVTMPLFSLFITFTVPGGVGIYWIFSNMIAVGQTVILNRIYNPAKIRAQAEIEYEQRRKQKAEDKKRLAEARARENAALNAANTAKGGKPGKAGKPGKQDKAGQAGAAGDTPAPQSRPAEASADNAEQRDGGNPENNAPEDDGTEE